MKWKKMCKNHNYCDGWIYKNMQGLYCDECRRKNNLLREKDGLHE